VASYGSKSILISIIQVDCAETAEKIVLTELKKRFQQDRSYGLEYFKVDNIEEFVGLVLNLCVKNCLCKNNNSLELQYNSLINNDKLFRCLRCGYSSDRKGKLVRHYNREKTCIANQLDIPISILKKVVDEPNDNVLRYI
jgi:hypothetical protein